MHVTQRTQPHHMQKTPSEARVFQRRKHHDLPGSRTVESRRSTISGCLSPLGPGLTNGGKPPLQRRRRGMPIPGWAGDGTISTPIGPEKRLPISRLPLLLAGRGRALSSRHVILCHRVSPDVPRITACHRVSPRVATPIRPAAFQHVLAVDRVKIFPPSTVIELGISLKYSNGILSLPVSKNVALQGH